MNGKPHQMSVEQACFNLRVKVALIWGNKHKLNEMITHSVAYGTTPRKGGEHVDIIAETIRN